MDKMTQRERYSIARAREDAMYYYSLFCSRSNQVPREDLLLMIKTATDFKALGKIEDLNKEAIEKLK